MKKFIFTIVVTTLLLMGCQQEDSMVRIEEQSGIDLIELPASFAADNSLDKKFDFTKTIKDSKGGTVKANVNTEFDGIFDGDPYDLVNGKVHIKANLDVPKYAFTDDTSLDITIKLDEQTATTYFSPSPYYFDKPLSYSIGYYGLDLSGVNPEDINFVYIADDGSTESVEYSELLVDVKQGNIILLNAQIHHFSRFAFTR